MKNLNWRDCLSIFIILAGIVFFTFLGVYGTPFNLDFVIIFSGGYSIFKGLIPYISFPLPPFPLPFLFQAFFQHIFGPGLLSLTVHSVILSSVLCLSVYYLVKKEFGYFFSVVFCLTTFYAFIGIISHPWYNQHAILLFFLNVILLIHYFKKEGECKKVFIFSAILAVLGVFSKTDIGLFHAVGIGAYLIYIYHKKIKHIVIYYVIPIIVSTWALNSLMSIITNSSSINFSSSLIVSRLSQLLGVVYLERLIYTSYFYVVILVIFIVFIYKISPKDTFSLRNRILALLFFSNLVMCGITLFSGQTDQNKIAFLPIDLFLFYVLIFWEDIGEAKKWPRFVKNKKRMFAMILIFLIVLNSFSYLSKYESNQYKSVTQEIKYVFLGTPTYDRESEGCYRGMLFSKTEFSELKKIRKLIEKNNKSFFVSGQFTFLYCDYNKIPPMGMPVWFHEGVTMSADDEDKIVTYISDNKPRVIIEQFYYMSKKTEFTQSLSELGYNKIDSIYMPRWGNNITLYELSS